MYLLDITSDYLTVISSLDYVTWFLRLNYWSECYCFVTTNHLSFCISNLMYNLNYDNIVFLLTTYTLWYDFYHELRLLFFKHKPLSSKIDDVVEHFQFLRLIFHCTLYDIDYTQISNNLVCVNSQCPFHPP